MTMVITGLDVAEKADHALAQLHDSLGGREQFDAVDVQLLRTDHPDASGNAEATALLRVTVKSRDAEVVGRRFSNEVIALTLQSYAGFFTTTPPTPASEFGVYWPVLIPRELVAHMVLLPDGTQHRISDPPTDDDPSVTLAVAGDDHDEIPGGQRGPDQETTRVPLGTVCGTRSGDKGGNANVGLWCDTDDAYEWLRAFLTVERMHELLPEAASLPIVRYELPNLRGLNFVMTGLLGEGVASSVRPDPQAKGLGEFLRSRRVDIPTRCLRADS